MWRVAVLFLLSGDAAGLVAEVHLQGLETDAAGRPLEEVRVEHAGTSRVVETNPDGRFEVRTKAPVIVLRKHAFTSAVVRIDGDARIEVKLQPASKGLPRCAPLARCRMLRQAFAELCLPRKIRGVRITAEGNDADYSYRYYLVRTPEGERGIQHASGPLWGFGKPRDEEVWWSNGYREANYADAEGYPVIDARGTSGDGKRWRVLGRFMESAVYRGRTAEEAAILDEALDRACVKRSLYERSQRK